MTTGKYRCKVTISRDWWIFLQLFLKFHPKRFFFFFFFAWKGIVISKVYFTTWGKTLLKMRVGRNREVVYCFIVLSPAIPPNENFLQRLSCQSLTCTGVPFPGPTSRVSDPEHLWWGQHSEQFRYETLRETIT